MAAGLMTVVLPVFAALAQETTVIPNRVIYPGEIVTSDALEVVALRRTLPAGANFAMMEEQIAGKVARRTLLPGRMISISAVREPYLVESGSPVTVRFVHGGLEISTLAVPLPDGAAGDMIRVRNMDSGAVFSGVVLADGTIRVGAT